MLCQWLNLNHCIEPLDKGFEKLKFLVEHTISHVNTYVFKHFLSTGIIFS